MKLAYEVRQDLPAHSADGTTAVAEIETGNVLAYIDPQDLLDSAVQQRVAHVVCDALNAHDPLRWPGGEVQGVPRFNAANVQRVEESNAQDRIDRYTGLRNAAQAVLDNWERGDLAAAVRQLAGALEAAPSFTDPTPNRVVLTVDGGVVQAVNADRPAEVAVTILDFDVDGGDEHPSVHDVTDANGIDSRIAVGGFAAAPIGPGLAGVLQQIAQQEEEASEQAPG